MKQNIYEALLERLQSIFCESENIHMSFSGGKDSGLLLNLVLDFRKKYCPDRQVGVSHQDFEAQYTVIMQYIEGTLERIKREAELYWACLSMTTRTALSSYKMYRYPQDDTKKEQWVHQMPDKEYVINLDYNPITAYRYCMHQEDSAKQFGRWYRKNHGDRRTICLLGIRADESFQRYSGSLNKKCEYRDECWISEQFKNVWYASPLCDWRANNIWHTNYLFSYDYDKLYDLYYKAGLTVSQMRVASPSNDYSRDAPNPCRVIDTEMWCRLMGRVQGANFTAIYGRTKAMGYRSTILPQEHTWKSYTQFLLDTLPKRLRNNYIRKFNTSIHLWHETGGGLDEKITRELGQSGYRIKRNGVSNYTLNKKSRVTFLGPILDDTDNIKSTKDIPSRKRMCYCILKNDYIRRFMGFGLTYQ